MKSKWIKLLAALFAVSLVAAACGSDTADVVEDAVDSGTSDELTAAQEALAAAEEAKEAAEADAAAARDEAEAAATAAADAGETNPLAGTAVTITGSERSANEAGAIQRALDTFAEANDMNITFLGSADWESEINVQVEAGLPPDISFFPQPGKLADFARDNIVVALPDATLGLVDANYPAATASFGVVDGTQFAVPLKQDLKSIVWYQPAAFDAAGYAIPETLDDFTALAAQMIEDGNIPLCVGIGSGTATGWPFTDWVEDMMLRRHSPEMYDQWVAGELDFASDEVSGVMQEIIDLWNTDGMVFADGGTIASTAFGEPNAEGLVNGDCFMHRQANFFATRFPAGTAFADGSDGAVDVFYFPEGDTGRPVLGAGLYAAAFDDRPEVWAVMDYLASADFANTRQVAQLDISGNELSGFLSPHLEADLSLWAPLEQSMLGILAASETFRFDASDLMPGDVGAGTFWTEGTALVNGDTSVAAAAATIDASWPEADAEEG